jgi:hypothetical protein
MGRWNIQKQHWDNGEKMMIKGVHYGDRAATHQYSKKYKLH